MVAFCFAAFGAVAAEFVPGVDDLPLMPGLEAAPERSTSFETPSGRIVEVETHGKGMAETDVRGFYARTLPSLGWRAVNERRYERAGERLIIDFTQRQGVLVVRFDIRPR